jgi:hypothetical protein
LGRLSIVQYIGEYAYRGRTDGGRMDWISIYSTEEDIWNIIYVNPLFRFEYILKSLYLRIFAEMGGNQHAFIV